MATATRRRSSTLPAAARWTPAPWRPGPARGTWPGRGEISAVQHAMNLKLDNERAFFAEYQNEPLRPSELRADVLTVAMVYEKGQRPAAAGRCRWPARS